ncbi:MAG: dienelactone hydrolase family protein [Dokdonella sp.]|nr:dienelactone hydrolase family protein [Dokdonella sp.]
MTMRAGWLVLAMVLALPAQAAMVERPIEYSVEGKAMQSVLVYDDAVKTARPGLVMTPDWLGISPASIALAKQIAGKDYVILVADVYGSTVRPRNTDEALATVKPLYADRAILRARINAALVQIKAQVGKAPLDGKHWGAFGFCFGGTTTLDLARSGADVGGVVSFHGGLEGDPAFKNRIKARVLVLHGADDSYEPPAQIAAFEQEMRDAGADWQFIAYGGAVHCFAIPGANREGCKYDERTAKRAFAQMRAFLAEVFATR